MIKLMVVGFCSNGIDASPSIGCKIWKENCLQGSKMTPRLHNSGYSVIYLWIQTIAWLVTRTMRLD